MIDRLKSKGKTGYTLYIKVYKTFFCHITSPHSTQHTPLKYPSDFTHYIPLCVGLAVSASHGLVWCIIVEKSSLLSVSLSPYLYSGVAINRFICYSVGTRNRGQHHYTVKMATNRPPTAAIVCCSPCRPRQSVLGHEHLHSAHQHIQMTLVQIRRKLYRSVCV